MIAQKTHIIDLFPGTFSALGKSPGFSFAKNKAIVYLGRLFEAVLEHKKAISSLIKDMRFSSI